MNRRRLPGLTTCLAVFGTLMAAISVLADDPMFIPLSKEPHHHLEFHHDYVNVYKIAVELGDTLFLHHHQHDGATVTVHAPGKPDVDQTLTPRRCACSPTALPIAPR